MYSTTERIELAKDVLAKVPLLLRWSPGEVSISSVSGGITNTLYKLSHTSEAAVLVRIFGGEDLFTITERDRETDIAVQLGEVGIGPRVRGKFANGRVEAFLDARALSTEEMIRYEVAEGVARNMARLHAFEPSKYERSPGELPLWCKLKRWSDEALRLARNGRFEHAGIDLSRLMEALKKTQQHISESNDIVFAHNDLLSGNLLRNSEGVITLIDFEYSDYNYRAYDIGNFFAEAMGGCDTGIVRTHQYPSLKFRRWFCSMYLTQLHGHAPTADAVDDLVDDAERVGLASHLYWGFWALVQSANSPVNFPYVKYAKQRFDVFFRKCDWV